jgi:hypothetical protein
VLLICSGCSILLFSERIRERINNNTNTVFAKSCTPFAAQLFILARRCVVNATFLCLKDLLERFDSMRLSNLTSAMTFQFRDALHYSNLNTSGILIRREGDERRRSCYLSWSRSCRKENKTDRFAQISKRLLGIGEEERDRSLALYKACWVGCSALVMAASRYNIAMLELILPTRFLHLLLLRQSCSNSDAQCFAQIDSVYNQTVAKMIYTLEISRSVPLYFNTDHVVAIARIVAACLILTASIGRVVVYANNVFTSYFHVLFLVFGAILALRKLLFVQKLFFILELALICIGTFFLAFSIISWQGIPRGFSSLVGAVHYFVLVAPVVLVTLVGLTVLVFSFYFADAVQRALVPKYRWLRFVRIGIGSVLGVAFIGLGIYLSWLNQTTIGLTSSGRVNPIPQYFSQLNTVAIGLAVLVALQFICAVVLLAHAVAAFLVARSIDEGNNEFQLRTLGRVIGVGVVLVLASVLALMFQLMSIPSIDLVAPDWAADIFGLSVPLVLITGALIFFIANALFSPVVSKQKGGSSRELQPLLERDRSHIPEQYVI